MADHTESPTPDSQATNESWQDTALRFLPLIVLPLAGLTAAALVILTASQDGDSRDSSGSGAVFPSPPPVTFIVPTPAPESPVPTEVGLIDQQVPDLTLTLLDGGTLRLPDLRGQIVFLNFWATWCVPCLEEMPALQALHETRSDDGVRVIAVTDPTAGQTEEEIRGFVQQLDLTLPVALEADAEVYRRFHVLQIPTTYIIDPTGTVRFRHIGPLSSDDINTYLEWLLAES